MLTCDVTPTRSGRRRAAAVAAGVPAAALATLFAVALVLGFPISLLLVPILLPGIVLGVGQARAAVSVWRSDPRGPGRLWWRCAVVIALLAGGFVLAAGEDDTTIRSAEAMRQGVIFRDVAAALLAVNLLALALLPLPSVSSLLTPRAVGRAAGTVLIAGIVCALFLPVGHTGR